MTTMMDVPSHVRDTIRLIGEPIRALGPDLVGCPVCDVTKPNASALGPHIPTHWKEIGILDPPAGTDRVDCPQCDFRASRHGIGSHLVDVHEVPRPIALGMARIAGFDLDKYVAAQTERAARAVADTEAAEAAEAAAEAQRERWRVNAAKKRAKKGKAVAPGRGPGRPVGSKNRPRDTTAGHELAVVEQHPVVSTIQLDDAVMAVLMSQINGSFPTQCLPDVLSWVRQTEALVAKLRAS